MNQKGFLQNGALVAYLSASPKLIKITYFCLGSELSFLFGTVSHSGGP